MTVRRLPILSMWSSASTKVTLSGQRVAASAVENIEKSEDVRLVTDEIRSAWWSKKALFGSPFWACPGDHGPTRGLGDPARVTRPQIETSSVLRHKDMGFGLLQVSSVADNQQQSAGFLYRTVYRLRPQDFKIGREGVSRLRTRLAWPAPLTQGGGAGGP